MVASLRVLAIIPARAGSKRLAGKNMLPLMGKPLVLWTVDAAIESKYITDVVVSTDDNSIIQLTRERDIITIRRPAELSSDTATTADVVRHAISYLSGLSKEYDVIVLLQPTSPLRKSIDIDSAFELFLLKSANSVVSMTQVDHSPLLGCALDIENTNLDDLYGALKLLPSRSQDLPSFYRLNGALYIVSVKVFLDQNSLFVSPGFAYIMPPDRSIDIDTMADYLYCKSLIEYTEL